MGAFLYLFLMLPIAALLMSSKVQVGSEMLMPVSLRIGAFNKDVKRFCRTMMYGCVEGCEVRTSWDCAEVRRLLSPCERLL